MDIQSLYELSQHFVHAISANPIICSAAHETYETAQNIITALMKEEAMPASDRVFQAGKLTVSSIGIVFCVATGSLVGAAGFAIPEAEAVQALNRKGAEFRATHKL
ncbi:MAG: hypothetical protein CMH31_06985 [Micavibrio sp.]|nr:hypothetical protein [Micavibrio sp.]|tara:strand:- start:232 stop:549 length:318 start_codon:yes stop_codon:yes gene_type:complete